MRTITEIAAPTLKNAAKVHSELTAAGKTPEELPAALGEALKLEGDKLTFMVAAIESVGGKLNDLKRVLVFALNEGEKAPAKAEQKGEHWLLAEYFPPIHKGGPAKQERGGKGGHDGDRKGKGRGGKGRGRRGERGGREGGRDGERAASDREGGRGNRRPPRGPSAGGAPKGVITPKNPQPKPAEAKPEGASEN